MDLSQEHNDLVQHREKLSPENNQNPPPPPQKCPRCDSSNTKFCYYNNYSLTQPRYFCKSCRRYWTQGGTLRNVPIGGGCRKSKRPKLSTVAPSTSESEITRTQSFTSNGFSGQQSFAARTGLTTQVMNSSMGTNSFYTGGQILPSFGGMQSLPNGGGRFGALLNLQSLRTDQAQQFHGNNNFYSSAMQRPLTSWAQGFMNTGTASTSAATPTFWSRSTGVNGGDQVGSSFIPNHWSYDNTTNHAGSFDHPPQ